MSAVLKILLPSVPPSSNTVPSLSRVAVWCSRILVIFPTATRNPHDRVPQFSETVKKAAAALPTQSSQQRTDNRKRSDPGTQFVVGENSTGNRPFLYSV